MKKCYRTLSFVMTCLLTFYITGCGSDDAEDEPANSSPIVDAFIIPAEFNPGEIIEFRVLAYDKDGDPLNYTWEVDAGKLSETSGTKVKWTAPSDVESVRVTVYVSDGVSKSTKRVKKIANQELLPPVPLDIPFDPTPDPPLNSIVPGKGAVGIKLGDPFKKVETLYGKPDDPPDKIGYFAYRDQNKGLSGFVDGIDLVESLFLNRPIKAKTAGGNSIGIAIKRVEEEYGKAQEIDNNDFGDKRHWYWRRGIEFTINEDDRVDSIYIFKPIAAAPQRVGSPLQHQQELIKAAIETLRRKEVLPTHSEY